MSLLGKEYVCSVGINGKGESSCMIKKNDKFLNSYPQQTRDLNPT